ncbi:Type I Iterative PKS [Trichoderma virens FT-333]|nr:Type I Iterative PKS [Trichoderma virens FT-333]
MATAGIDGISIAITGLSCRFPGDGDNPVNYWKLVCEGKSAWSMIPKERFHGDAFWSGGKKRHGSVTKSGHFLKHDISHFDANFFNISASEANAMDPQHRIALEVVYEALESAGYSVQSLAGTRTGVFMGHFTSDYKELVISDTDAIPPYATTGLNKTSLANRISWTFDLRGPSFALDTACSSSLVAFHLACQSLRAGESDIAIVGGTNVLLNPDMFVAFSGQGFLSPDGKCKSFDASGDGYGRGEGVAAIVLKRVDDAIVALDPLRAIIRATGSNQDGHTKSLTLPSADAQEALIRDVYRLAKLDFAQTSYVEAHGTGTQAGDTTETLALSRTIAKGRSSKNKLIVGSVKANIGHLEAASGLAGVIKSVLMLERGVIPPNIHFHNPNPMIDFANWNIQIPNHLMQWPNQGTRRISINSFGYGGTNAHAIVDDAYSYLGNRGLRGLHYVKTLELYSDDGEKEEEEVEEEYNSQPNTPRIFVLTAQDRAGLSRMKKSLASWLRTKIDELGDDLNKENHLADLAYTLSDKRSRLQWKTFALASSLDELADALESSDSGRIEAMSSSVPRLGFVFTGQGAQWATMGMALMAYPEFSASIEAADLFLRKKLNCSWSPRTELFRGRGTSRLGLALYSQTLCTVLQIALVDLLRKWAIIPDAVVGHSSGEIAAAYCAGYLSREDAWQIAYCRGVACSNMKVAAPDLDGAMMAVGASPDACSDFIKRICPDKVNIACINSPSSVTLSGDATAIATLQEALQEENIFARKLLVDTAYHSKHMQLVAQEYLEAIADIQPRADTTTASNAGCKMYSSVTESEVTFKDLGPDYWVRNLVSPVRFATAIQNLMRPDAGVHSNSGDAVDVLVEIGPHAALQGPATQRAGFLAMAIEAALQTADTARNVKGFYLRDIEFLSAMLIPEDDELEHTISLRSDAWVADSIEGLWTEFVICSSPDRKSLMRNCRGFIRVCYDDSTIPARETQKDSEMLGYKQASSLCKKEQMSAEFYQELDDLGYHYGPAFANITEVWSGDGQSCGSVTIPNIGLDDLKRPHVIHPTTLDAMFHLAFAAANGNRLSKLTVPMVPKSMDEMYISIDIPFLADTKLKGFSKAHKLRSKRQLKASVGIMDETEQQSVLEISGLYCAEIARMNSSGKTSVLARKMCSKLIWRPSINLITNEDIQRITSASTELKGGDASNSVAAPQIGMYKRQQLSEFINIFHHTTPTMHIVELAQEGSIFAQDNSILKDVLRTATYTVLGYEGKQRFELGDSPALIERGSAETPSADQDLFQKHVKAADLVVCSAISQAPTNITRNARLILKDGGKICTIETSEHVPAAKSALQEAGFTNLFQFGGFASGEPVFLVGSVESTGIIAGSGLKEKDIVLIQPANANEFVTAIMKQLKTALFAPGHGTSIHTWGIDNISALKDKDCVALLEYALKNMTLQRQILMAMSANHLFAGIDEPLGYEAAGVIVRVGSSVTKFRPGDSVVMYSLGLANQTLQRTREEFCHPLPSGYTFTQAISGAAAHAVAWYALDRIARIQSGQSILIHDAADDVGQAAIQIAHNHSLEIYATIKAETDQALLRDTYNIPEDHIFNLQDPHLVDSVKLMTNGRGVDILLSSPTNTAHRQTSQCLADFGTFVEVGLRDSPRSTMLDTRFVPQDATFSSFSLNSIATKSPRLMGQIICAAFELYQKGIVKPIASLKVFSASQVESAVQYAQTDGQDKTIILSFNDNDLVPVLGSGMRQPIDIDLSSDACYMLVGGLGGLGRSLAMMLAENGARKLCFLSRSGAASTSATDLIHDLKGLGVQVECLKCDVSDISALKNALDRCSVELGPVHGVIQCAMVLRDTLFANMSYDQWQESTLPKVQGTQNLHKTLPDVDFFVTLSSFAGTFGNRGQSNYAAGCAYQDALALQRRDEGKKATTIDVGLMRDIGVLAENGMTDNLKDWEEPYGVREGELRTLVKLAIAGRLPAQVLTGLATGGSAVAAGIPTPFYLADAKFSLMGATDLDKVNDATSDSNNKRKSDTIRALISNSEGLPEAKAEDVDTSRALHSYGLDSLVAIEIVDWALKEIEARVSVFDIMAAVPITATASKIANASALLARK